MAENPGTGAFGGAGWRQLRGFNRLPDVVKGIRFQDGIAVPEQLDETEEEQKKVAA